MHPFHAHCRETLDAIQAQGRYRRFTPLQKQADRFPLYRRPDGSEVLVWSSNDYLGMGGHPAVVQAACSAAQAMGAGAGGTRNIGDRIGEAEEVSKRSCRCPQRCMLCAHRRYGTAH